jgi:hypothetical protein
MIDRKIHYIDVSKMSEKEICALIGVKYVPWYRSSFFWSLLLLFTSPSLIVIMDLLK